MKKKILTLFMAICLSINIFGQTIPTIWEQIPWTFIQFTTLNAKDICGDLTEHSDFDIRAHPNDLTKFIMCYPIGKIASINECPTGLEFNPQIKMCDWPSPIPNSSTTFPW